jgi:hypothetical protein
MVSILFDLLTSKKTAPSFIGVEKNFFEIGRKGYQKKLNFALISKMCRTFASITEVGKMTAFDLLPIPWVEGHGVQGQICDILRPQLA